MFLPFRLATILCATSGLMAQTMNDLNSLVLQASRYADHQSAGQAQPPELTLFRIIGNTGSDPDECTFIFKCPLDHQFVGISAQTGKKLWTEPFPY